MHPLLLSNLDAPQTLSRSQVREIETVAAFLELLKDKKDPAAILVALAEQTHRYLSPSPSLIIFERDDGIEIAAVAPKGEDVKGFIERGRELCAYFKRCPEEIQCSIGAGVFPLSGLGISFPHKEFNSILCAQVRTSRTNGLLVLPLQRDHRLSIGEQQLVGTMACLASLALSNAELSMLTQAQRTELQELSQICAEMGSTPTEKFLEKFVVSAASILGFRASFLALLEEGVCRMRWSSRGGVSRPLDVELDSLSVRQVIAKKEPYWSEEKRDDANGAHWDQLFAIPLVGADGECLGILGLLDRLDHAPISPDDVRRAKTLAAQAAVALEAARNVALSDGHRDRAETLVAFALELGPAVEVEELITKFTSRASELLQARVAFIAVPRGPRMQTVLLQGIKDEQEKRIISGRISRSLDSVTLQALRFARAVPAEKFDISLARENAWQQVIVTPLFGTGDELLGLLGLVDCQRNSQADVGLVQAMAMHAAAALQNSQLFSRITRSSRQWAEIFDSISDFMLLHDEHQRVLRVNRSFADKLKKQPADLLGVPVRDLLSLPANTPACPFCIDLRGDEFREEFRDPRTGNVYLISSSHLRGGMEESQQIVHVMKDVSASQRAERLYRDLFDNIQEGAYFSTPDGRLIEVNNALVRMLGYDSREELLAVQSEKLYLDPAHREESKRALHQFGRLRNHEAALLRRDGSIIYVLENSFVIRDEAAQVIEYRGVLLDITEMKHVQSQLLREHDFNTQILNHTQSLIAVVDTAGLVSYANRRCCEIATGGEGDLVGLRLETIVVSSHRHLLRDALQSALDGMPINNVELPLVRDREIIGSFSVNLSPMRNPAGEVNSIVAVMTDITDIAMLQAKLMHTEKMAAVGQLVSGVAHEVNNPLTAILGFADLLLENPETSMDAKDDLEVIVQEAQRTREIVQNLLSFARQTPPEKQPVDVNQVLRRTISLRSYDLNNHGIELQECLDPQLPEVIGDAHQLQQVFLNILNNACDAVRETGRRGRIVVATEKVAGSVELRFCDNGTGVATPERIFDPFYTTKDVGKGTGLGLSICYGIVREHGGEIQCFNNQDSPGATFCVRLPLMQHSQGKVLTMAAGS